MLWCKEIKALITMPTSHIRMVISVPAPLLPIPFPDDVPEKAMDYAPVHRPLSSYGRPG